MTEQLTGFSLTLLNPRRDSWNASWPQEIDFGPFKEQVEWELEGLEMADLILLYFDPATQPPISLLELGLHTRSSKIVVCCPVGLWRKGNVDIVCRRYGIPQVETLEDLIPYIKSKLLRT